MAEFLHRWVARRLVRVRSFAASFRGGRQSRRDCMRPTREARRLPAFRAGADERYAQTGGMSKNIFERLEARAELLAKQYVLRNVPHGRDPEARAAQVLDEPLMHAPVCRQPVVA